MPKMKRIKNLQVRAGKTCVIDVDGCGIILEGPARVICIKEKDLVETESRDDLSCLEKRVAVLEEQVQAQPIEEFAAELESYRSKVAHKTE